MARRRLAALGALVFAAATLAFAVFVAVEEFPRGLIVFACVAGALAAAWYGVLHRGAARKLGLATAAVFIAGAIALFVTGHPVDLAIVVAGVVLSIAAARLAFSVHVSLPRAPRPARPFLIYNPRSGGGKAERFGLGEEAAKRGIESIELTPGVDLEQLVRDAVDRGADALAVAGGDGTQAIVAAIAADLDLPYACVPAGTRNHFALDLGVDRADVVGALDAFVDGGEHRVDLAEVNGRVFVNNVSLGLYADAVQHAGYRDAKLRTLLDTVPEVLGPDARGLDLHWEGPEGEEREGGAAILVSNNRYRLGRAIGSGTRPRMDEGRLGVAVVGDEPATNGGRRDPGRLREWTTSAFEVSSAHEVPAGIDGEAVMLEAPLRFRTRPRALRVRVAQAHPGASPSAAVPAGTWQAVRALADIAVGRSVSGPARSP
jgi:diacylglycerol kinase family enzyme